MASLLASFLSGFTFYDSNWLNQNKSKRISSEFSSDDLKVSPSQSSEEKLIFLSHFRRRWFRFRFRRARAGLSRGLSAFFFFRAPLPGFSLPSFVSVIVSPDVFIVHKNDSAPSSSVKCSIIRSFFFFFFFIRPPPYEKLRRRVERKIVLKIFLFLAVGGSPLFVFMAAWPTIICQHQQQRFGRLRERARAAAAIFLSLSLSLSFFYLFQFSFFFASFAFRDAPFHAVFFSLDFIIFFCYPRRTLRGRSPAGDNSVKLGKTETITKKEPTFSLLKPGTTR